MSADIYERLTGERVWEQPWPQAEEALSGARGVRAGVPGQRQAARPRAGGDGGRREQELKELCKAAPNVKAHLDGKQIVKEIVVPGKLVNLVVR